jgi:hypothetical protein
MTAVLAVLAAASALTVPPARLDPQHLPRLPERGLARATAGGVMLETLRGRPIGLLPGLHLAYPPATHGLLLQDGRARLSAYDPFRHRLRRVSRMPQATARCRTADQTMRQQLQVCRRRITVALVRPGGTSTPRLVAGPRRGLGRWAWAEFSPNGRSILAQWSGECESPSAYLIVGGRVRPYGGSDAVESVGLGWLPDGRAVVSFWSGICGAGISAPGVYAVPLRGKPERLRRTNGRAPLLAMWGG